MTDQTSPTGPAALRTWEPIYRELQRLCPDCRSPKQAGTEHGYGCPAHRDLFLAALPAPDPVPVREAAQAVVDAIEAWQGDTPRHPESDWAARLRVALAARPAPSGTGCSDPEHPGGAFCINTTGLITCYAPEDMRLPSGDAHIQAALDATRAINQRWPSEDADAARERLSSRRVVTEHLSVPVIIETYARRLCDAYPDNCAVITEERDDILAWFALRAAAPSEGADPMLGTPSDGRHPDHACGQSPCPHIPTVAPSEGAGGLDVERLARVLAAWWEPINEHLSGAGTYSVSLDPAAAAESIATLYATEPAP